MSTAEAEQLASERLHSAHARVKLARVGLSSKSIQQFLGEVVDDLHVKTILSLANATLGVLHAASLCVHVIGQRAVSRKLSPESFVQFVMRVSRSLGLSATDPIGVQFRVCFVQRRGAGLSQGSCRLNRSFSS